jgi:methylenetetrahydrofolate reductase (NADH)
MAFKDALRTKDFVVTAHLNLVDLPSADTLIRHGQILQPAVDAVHLTETKSAHIAGIAAAALLLQHDIDPIVHMNCRDRNSIALQKDLMGAVALGVTSVVISRGMKIPKSVELGIRNVFDTTALDFMTYIQGLNQANDAVPGAEIAVGANAEVFAPGDDWIPNNLIRKCDAGANFVQLQVCFDMDVARSYMARIVASKLTHRANFIMALLPLPSADVARWVRENVKGALIPDGIIERLEQASDPEREGIEICAELLQELKSISGVAGADLLNLGNIESIPAAIEASGVRAP